ncbi:glycosyltransferase family 2 protein [Oceanidesulfovibrio marinus]|uniref:Glycosyltransferase n=1 Tax=Oceanidesulfovibrio marinus TaxID=370038 RepID=A0ABX6NBH9_9BACT|nr:glycosyltransferase [Oceanidesulfovibrio marinus]QJT07950.1 glycosyltransferase [Oceanidesulfovibrio marinus]
MTRKPAPAITKQGMRQETPAVSIIITCYNYGQYVGEALDSVLNQTFTDWEAFVVDDGSTDNTADVVSRYLDDPRVRYVYQQNAGQASAKNTGIREAKGEFVAFLDADDIWQSEKLAMQLPLFSNPNVGVVYSKRRILDTNGVIRTFYHPPLHRGNVLDHMFIDNFVCFSSSIARRSILNDARGFDESLDMGIDYDLWIRLAARYEFDFVDAPLVTYRVGHTGQMSNKLLCRLDHAWEIMHKNLLNEKIATQISKKAKKRAFAMTHCTTGRAQLSSGNRYNAYRHFFLSACNDLTYMTLWKELVKIIIRRERNMY